MLSLVAMTSAPMAMYANADLTKTVDKAVEAMQPGTGLSIQDGVFASTGAPVELTIGKLVKGEYKLTAGTIGTNVKLTVNGKELAGGVFELDGETTVVIKAESTDGKGFSVGGFGLELNYDFKAAYTNLNTPLSTAYSSMDINTEDFWEKDLLKEYNAELAQRIETIKDGDETAYDVYVKERLYEDDINNSEIGKAVKTFADNVAKAKANASAKDYADGQIPALKDAMNGLNAALNADVKDMFAKRIADISAEITAFENGIKAAYEGKTAATEFAKETVDDKVNKINETITLVSNDITVAKDNFAAYKTVKGLADAAKAKYNQTVQNLITLLSGETYAKMLQEAQGKLSEQYAKISEVEKLNGTDAPAATAAANQEANTATLNVVDVAIEEINGTYTTRHTALEEAYKTLTGEVEGYKTQLAEKKKTLQEDIKTTAHDTEIAAIEKAIAELEAMVEKAHNDYNVDELGTKKEYTDKKADIDKRWNALTAASDKTIANYEANAEVTASVKALDDALAAAKEEIAKCVSEDKKFNGTTAWSNTVKTLEEDIKKYTEDAAKAYAAGTSADYKTANTAGMEAKEGEITDCVNEVKAALAKYQETVTAIADNGKALDEVRAFVGTDGAVTDADGKSYTAKIADIQARIDALQKSLDNAMTKQDGELATALAAIIVDENIATDIAAMTEEQFKADKETYEGTINVDAAKSQLAYQTNRQTAISERIGKFSTDNTEAALGKKYTDINEKFGAIKAKFDAVEIPADEITAENAGDIRTKLVEVNATFNEVEAELDALDKEVEPVKAAVKANNDQKTAADNRVAVLKSTTENNKVDAEDIKGNNKDTSRNEEFTKLYDEVMSLIGTQEEAITAAYGEETLVSKWSGISAELDKIEAKIKDYAAQATASTKNLEAKDAQNKAVEKAKFADLIKKEKDNVAKVTKEGAGRDYFNSVLDGISEKDIETLNSNIEKNYNERKSVDYKSEVDKEIKRIKTAISGVAKAAEANEKAYDAQIALQKETQAEWNRVYTKLSAEDKSSQLQAYLDKLTAIQVEINDLNKTVEESYGQGKSTESDLASKYSELINKIGSVESDQSGAYNATIASDNAARYEAFKEAIGETQKKYNEVVNSIAKFSGASNEYFADKITAILEANKDLYTYPQQIRDLTSKAGDEYGKAVSPLLYDETEANLAAANELTAAIDELYKNFIEKANEAAKEALNEKLSEAKNTLADAVASLEGYGDKVKNEAFSDIKVIINNAEASAKNDNELAVNIDGILNSLSSIEEDNLVSEGQEAAAVAEYNAAMTAIDNKIKADREELATFVFAEINTTDYLAAYNQAVDTYIDGKEGAKAVGEAAIKDKKLFGENLAAVKALIEYFKTNNKYDEAKTSAESNAESLESWNKMTAELDKLQAALGEAKAYADGYFVDTPQNDGVQADIDKLRKKADDAKKIGTAKDVEADVLDGCKDIAENIKNLNALADAAESAGLNNAIEELKIEYNKAVATGSADENITEYEKTIAGYGEELDKINAEDFDGDKHASYIALEKKIAQTRTELANIYDNALATNTYNSLIAALDEIKTNQAAETTVLDACNVVVKEEYGEALAGILEKVEAVKADVEIANAEGTLLFYNDNLNKEITAVADELKEISDAIDIMQAPYTANDEAYARLTGELKGLQDAYDALAEKLAGYTYVDQKAFAEAAKEFITDKIAEDKAAVEAAHNATELDKMLDADSKLANKTDVEASIAALDKNNSKTETTGRIKTVEDVLATAKQTIGNSKFTAEAKEKLDKEVEDLEKAITSLKTYNDDAAQGSINKDINGDVLVGEDGKEVEFKTVKFVEEAVPAIFAKVAELTEAIDNLNTEAGQYSYIHGDVNRDGSVFADDYTIICNTVLEKDKLEEGSVEFLAADINEDGTVNIGDVSAVARIIRGTESTVATSSSKVRRVSSAVTKTNDIISLTSEGEGTKRRIAINLQNGKAYNACQMDIKLPAGLSLTGENVAARADGLTLMSNDLSNGTHRILLSSLDEAEIDNGAGAIVCLDVEVGYNYSGEDIVVSDVLFTDSSARMYSSNGTGGDGTTGIDTITIGEAFKGKIYSVGGKLMNGLKQGVNIIRGNDGSTKKVIVK